MLTVQPSVHPLLRVVTLMLQEAVHSGVRIVTLTIRDDRVSVMHDRRQPKDGFPTVLFPEVAGILWLFRHSAEAHLLFGQFRTLSDDGYGFEVELYWGFDRDLDQKLQALVEKVSRAIATLEE